MIVATNIARIFPSIKWRFLVGIAQYDHGKDTEDGFQLKGLLYPPPELIAAIGIAKVDDKLLAALLSLERIPVPPKFAAYCECVVLLII